jgi:CheY-like chemotaxis protein
MKKKHKILVADDDANHVDVMKTILEHAGYEVACAYRAEEAVEAAKSDKPDLILLDVLFAGPGDLDGIELSRRLRSDPVLGTIPIIILSGVHKALDLNFKLEPDEDWMPVQAFLEKPVLPERLLAEVASCLPS